MTWAGTGRARGMLAAAVLARAVSAAGAQGGDAPVAAATNENGTKGSGRRNTMG
jgi:hypothetical protein